MEGSVRVVVETLLMSQQKSVSVTGIYITNSVLDYQITFITQ